MSTRNQLLSLSTLLAPSHLVTGLILRSGHDIGVAATISGKLTFEFPALELDDRKLAAIERAATVVVDAYEAYRWRLPVTDDEIRDLVCFDIEPVRTLADRFREQKMRLQKLRAAVAKGDRCLPSLLRHGFVLAVTTRQEGNVKKKVAPKRFSGFPAPTYPYSAAVSVQRVP